MSHKIAEVAIAILYQDNKFLMQLRDNNPAILYPGYWAFFGGHLEMGETPETAVQREVLEEINYTLPPSFAFFGIYPDAKAIRHVFHAPLEVGLEKLELNEGWDMGLVPLEDVIQGKSYSAIAQEFRPIGPAHQRILLDFAQEFLP
ncbi:NUDIX hydrolase [Calothrix sp. 336/3]|uniref:NUDIX hydrolase n=1 Tax=Calothrix sp. 336/3 TaxID=1337936 RepID=UPI0004E35E8E|nr:NUDIX hydrolase [Calothrix sp. 336/3]AKG20103.1 NUDIX hydrolase [Calothrix sp. 336/3]